MKTTTKWVVAVGGMALVVAAVALVFGFRSLEESFRRNHCQTNLLTLGFALKQYAAAHDDYYPDRWEQVTDVLAHNPDAGWDAFLCPDDPQFHDRIASFDKTGFEIDTSRTSYVLVSGYSERRPDASRREYDSVLTIGNNRWNAGEDSSKLGKTERYLPLAYEREDYHHDGLHSVLFLDGHTDVLPLRDITERVSGASRMGLEEFIGKYADTSR